MTDAITKINRVALETQDNGPMQDIRTIIEYLAGEDTRDDAEISKSQIVPSETPDSQLIEQSATTRGSYLSIAGYESTIAVVGKTDAGTPEMGVLVENTDNGHIIGTVRTADVEGLVDRLRDIEDEVSAHDDGLELMG